MTSIAVNVPYLMRSIMDNYTGMLNANKERMLGNIDAIHAMEEYIITIKRQSSILTDYTNRSNTSNKYAGNKYYKFIVSSIPEMINDCQCIVDEHHMLQ